MNNNIFERLNSGLFFIFLGLVFLLNTLGILSWSIWGNIFSIIMRVWPIILIYVGLQIILSRNYILSILLKIFFNLIFILLFVFSILITTGTVKDFYLIKIGDEQEVSYSVEKNDFGNVAEIDYDFDFVSSNIEFKSVNNDQHFFEMFAKSFGPNPQLENRVENDKLLINLSHPRDTIIIPNENRFILNCDKTASNIKLDLVAGNFLGDLENIKNLKMNLTASTAEIKLTNLISNISIDGVGSTIDLKLEKDRRLEIKINSTFSSVNFGDKALNENEIIINPDKGNTINLTLNITASSLNISYI